VSRVFLGIGSNQGDRNAALEFAVQKLSSLSRKPIKISCIYETQALLPEASTSDWNLPFLNMAVEIDYAESPMRLLSEVQSIEAAFGRIRKDHWAPRTLDIDILYWHGLSLQTPELKLPHSELLNRAFVLDPLKDLAPSLILDGHNQNILEYAHKNSQHLPSVMGILNVTPDSFSDGGAYFAVEQIEKYISEIEKDVGYIDIGAESTRPEAKTLTIEEEWVRLEPVLRYLQLRYQNKFCRPKISLDTYHGEVAERALAYGIDVINDVSGLACAKMRELLKTKFNGQYVLMHSVSVPADRKKIIDSKLPVMDYLLDWFRVKFQELEEIGINRDRIIIDPGLGFGKNQKQSFEILRGFSKFWDLGCQVLIGHSRKSFLAPMSSPMPILRDYESIGLSVGLANSGVDILRVHNPQAHKKVINGLHIYQNSFLA
jgi:2-amino-4-hydroxy-6-hydroxymethyldihydropteridine diphosphokinase/dihydropteroate synthase